MKLDSIRSSLRSLLLLLNSLSASCSPQAFERGTDGRKDLPDIPPPLSISPSQYWDGIDGEWSSFTLRLGTPEQLVRVFISFTIYQTLAVLPQGCETSAENGACADARGWIFEPENSSTFQEIGIYDTWVGSELGYQTNAKYGFEAVGLGGEAAEGPTLTNATLGGMAAASYYMGIFGLCPEPTNFTTFDDPTTSYMTQLKKQGLIPSSSFSYTAGAHYRFVGTFASLTLGGYDNSRYHDNNVTFQMTSGYEQDAKVVVQSITASRRDGLPSSGTELFPRPVIAMIDATFPEIWLPVEVCEAFEQEFGLMFDNTTELYLVNETLHTTLLARDANVTFTIGQDLYGPENVKITLPYAAFDLKAQAPFGGLIKETNYFPLKRADGTGRYGILLGRTFLQEAYITVNYEASQFWLAQIAWNEARDAELVGIPSDGVYSSSADSDPATTSDPISSDSNKYWSAGAIAGAVVGSVASIALIGGLFILFRRSIGGCIAKPGNKQDPGRDLVCNAKDLIYVKAELAGSLSTSAEIENTPPLGRSDRNGISELPQAPSRQTEIWELPGDLASFCEKDGKSLSEKETMLYRERLYNGVDVELEALLRATKRGEGLQSNQAVNTNNTCTSERARTYRAFSFEMERNESQM